MKYFLYCRKSSEEEDRQILSIESQKDEIKKRFPDTEILELPAEAKSAFKPYNRPIFAAMMERLQKGEADGIIAYDPSRLSRNPIDAGAIIHFLDIGVIKDLKFASYHFDNSPEGKMMLNFSLSQSKYSSDKLSKDVKRGMLKKCSRGSRPNMAPTGYMNDPFGLKGEKQNLEDPERFDLVRKMWDMVLSGKNNPSDIRTIANEEWHFKTRKYKSVGGKPISISTLYRIFTNPFYYGEYGWDGQWYKGNHKPMVTKEEFDRVQLILGRKGKPRPQKHRFAFTGLIRCANCGCMVTAETKLKKLKKTSATKSYSYYRCTHRSEKTKCNEPAIQQKDLEEQITSILKTIEIPKNLLHCTINYLSKATEYENKDRGKIQLSLQDSFNDCTKRIENLLNLYISPQNSNKTILSDEEFSERKISLMKEKEEIKIKMNQSDQRLDDWVELTEQTFKFAAHARYLFGNGTLEDKKAVFQALGQNFLLKDRKLTVELHKPFIAIKEGMEKMRAQKQAFSLISVKTLTWDTLKKSELFDIWSR